MKENVRNIIPEVEDTRGSVEDRMILLCSTNNIPDEPNIGKDVDNNKINILFKNVKMSCYLQDQRDEHK